ncbi:MAG: hypothetical protein COW00_11270 [Bdellovibrio sp. CG12_big_fil_rev_8_21_14_0_65_39_13]|nr:MAG: hypothetical protein COW78_16625 [Bdellovibrio sp. CG22_combo_CG10-13_8_21_14_all_39_27]PIQ59301.1 MAG: hypothetical protein COW00_11270 [Bdellovibrio sp. CG12_big_fil_rev_8_21_14_0_65_39_13]PIR32312.1 MAG: hypothetical protein COV37_20560 [Bdellovibrio sp. CG11_big_fil_rev_8_21_14_0_20_39_38]
MKLFFSLFFLLTSMNTVYARDIIVISFDERVSDSQLIFRELTENLNISPRLISLIKYKDYCPHFSEAQFVICLKNNDQIISWKKFDKKMNAEALNAFWNFETTKKEASEEASNIEIKNEN